MGKQSGQALLIVVLTMVVALTVGLSVVSRSITNVRISTSEEESQRAFSAAEAGVEELLKSGAASAADTLPNQAIYNARAIAVSSPTEFLVPGTANKDEAVQVWLSNYPDYASPYSGQITIYWGDPAEICNNVAAIEAIILSGSTTSPTINRYLLDPCSRGNNFTLVSGGAGAVQGVNFGHSYLISVTNGLIMRMIPLYKSTNIAVKGNVVLPSQGKDIESTGEFTSAGQKVVRKIRVFQSHPSLPSIFDHAIFSGTSLP
ncbi:hypothetical protein HYS29_00310 [Candidatus Microgenomates bacterium]|nr:hypothetical protein [Candidatus Microgenomates bacterium]